MPAALQVHHRRHAGDVGAVVGACPVRLAGTMADPIPEPGHGVPGQGLIGLLQREGERGMRQPPRGADQSGHLAGDAVAAGEHPLHQLHPAQRVSRREAPAGVHEDVGEAGRRVLNQRDLPFGDVAGGQLPLHVAEVAGAPGGQLAAEPRLGAQPAQRAVAVGGVDDEPVEAAAGSGRAAQALIEHLVAALGQQRREPVQGVAAAVGAAQQHQRRAVLACRVVVRGQQPHTVGGRDLHVAPHPHPVP